MADSAEKKPNHKLEPQTHAEAVSKLHGGGRFEELKEIQPNSQSEETAGTFSPKGKGEKGR
ncbi:hypothetical protein ACQCSU_00765 [Pseudarthrobacter sp. O4]|uniref:hypothetical protein n=1 Tax=Pseudarthrobacter sp. O4 TaxID=3418417 RepID=UPI003CE8BB11